MSSMLRVVVIAGLSASLGCSGGSSPDVTDVPVAQDIQHVDTGPRDVGPIDAPVDNGNSCGFVPMAADDGCIVLEQTCTTGPVTCPDGTTINTTCHCETVHMGGMFWRCDDYCGNDAAPPMDTNTE